MYSCNGGQGDFGYSLHHIDESFDAGDLIDVRTKEIDYQKAILGNVDAVYKIGVEMVLGGVEKLARGCAYTKNLYHQIPLRVDAILF